jgi:hypothetical protein
MTKVETKALEKYPVKHRLNKKATGGFDSNLPRRKAYIEGYHQAIADACEWIKQQQEMLDDCFSDAGDFADLLIQAMEE